MKNKLITYTCTYDKKQSSAVVIGAPHHRYTRGHMTSTPNLYQCPALQSSVLSLSDNNSI